MWFMCASAAALNAQASLRGKTLTDSAEHPISGVVVSIDDLKIQDTSDSLGNFLLPNVKPGQYMVSAKKIGFGALTAYVRFGANEKVEADFLLKQTAQSLNEVKVETKAVPRAKLVDFEERRANAAGGRFLTQQVFESRAWGATSDVIRSNVPGLEIKRSGKATVVVGGRMQVPGGAFTNGGNPPGDCPAAIVLDGIFVFQGNGEPPFDINSVPPTMIAGMEYYSSPASIPVKYNGTRGTCGLMIIWTK